MKLQATARVVVTIECSVGVWGDDCPMAQVYKQAADSALERLRVDLQQTGWRVNGAAKVMAILTEEKS